MDTFFITFFAMMLLMPALIFFIAYLAAQSRKKKQQALMNDISDVEYSALVRYNKGNQQDKFLKVKAFEGSGVLYVKDGKIQFVDTLHRNPHTFDLKTCNIQWVDINLVNGFLKWFSISDDAASYYFNIDSGMLIWNLDKSKPTTQSVFETLKKMQDEV